MIESGSFCTVEGVKVSAFGFPPDEAVRAMASLPGGERKYSVRSFQKYCGAGAANFNRAERDRVELIAILRCWYLKKSKNARERRGNNGPAVIIFIFRGSH